jgi:hypothetical protein
VRATAAGPAFTAAKREPATLKAFVDGYRDTRADWSEGMRLQFNLAARDAEQFFGADRRLGTITRADADAFRASLAARLSVETVRVFSRKTESSRTVPLIPVLRDELLKAFDRAAEGAEGVLQRRQPLPPIRRAVESAIERAGLTAWPRLFQQLRASFATDCVRTLPANVAAAILGHSAKVAAEHYWMTEAHDLEQAGLALRQALPGGALQNPVQCPAASGRAESHEPEPEPEPAQARRNDDLRENAAPCETHETASMGAAGFEPA